MGGFSRAFSEYSLRLLDDTRGEFENAQPCGFPSLHVVFGFDGHVQIISGQRAEAPGLVQTLRASLKEVGRGISSTLDEGFAGYSAAGRVDAFLPVPMLCAARQNVLIVAADGGS